ncbi:hypothetical protein BDA96_04G355000 [Sorghum bicolor]|uniref:Uncharacterized protein n=1 Tax=Sorghum bicolor TaxID=4558 RepID=A0A921R766_SORBI|nr:hypothetical protein BDA96_04G355000 [Sorghum bicolor]
MSTLHLRGVVPTRGSLCRPQQAQKKHDQYQQQNKSHGDHLRPPDCRQFLHPGQDEQCCC